MDIQMKQLILISMLFFFSIALNGSLEAFEYSASGHPDWPPFSWKSGNKIIGVGPELVKKIFNDIGIKNINYNYRGNWERVLLDTKTGNLDILVSAYKTPKRAKFLNYAEIPYAYDENKIWTLKGHEFAFKNWKDLIDKKGAMAGGESFGEEIDNAINLKLIDIYRVSYSKKILTMLENGRIDYYPYSYYSGLIFAKQLGYDEKIVSSPISLSVEPIYISISKKSKLVFDIKNISKLVDKYKKDGTVKKIIDKYMRIYLDGNLPNVKINK